MNITNAPDSLKQQSALAWRWQVNPGLGLFSSVFGTALAMFLVPDDVQAAGNLFWPALVLALSLLVVPLRGMLISPTALFHPVSILAASPVYWILLDPIQGAYPINSVGADEVRLAFFAVGLFSSFVWLACFGSGGKLPKTIENMRAMPFSNNAIFIFGLVAFSLAFLRFAIPAEFDLPLMFNALFTDRWSAPWARGSLGGWDAFLDHIGYFGYIVPPLTGILVRRVGLLNIRTVSLILLCIILIALFSTGGGRRIVGVMVGGGYVAWFISSSKPKLRDLFILGIGMTLLLAFMQLMLIYRGVGIGEAFSEQTRKEAELSHLHVDDNFLRLAEVMNIVPEQHPHVTYQWLVWVLVRPVPRVFWQDKPETMGFDLAAFLGKQGVALSMSLIGELYVAFGFWGCAIGGFLLGRIARRVASVMNAGPHPGAVVLLSASLFALFCGMRSGIDLVLMSYGVLAWIALTWFYNRRKAKQLKRQRIRKARQLQI